MNTEKQKPLKLFVWHGVLADYTSGVAFALAPNVKEARRLIAKRLGKDGADGERIAHEQLSGKPTVITASPYGDAIYGGG